MPPAPAHPSAIPPSPRDRPTTPSSWFFLMTASATSLELVLPHDGHHSVTLLHPHPAPARCPDYLRAYCRRSWGPPTCDFPDHLPEMLSAATSRRPAAGHYSDLALPTNSPTSYCQALACWRPRP